MDIALDQDTNHLLGEIARILTEQHSDHEAELLVRDYYQKFTDASYCRSIGIPVQDDDFFFHESAGGMALRIHYYLVLRGNPDPHRFIEWRTKHLGHA